MRLKGYFYSMKTAIITGATKGIGKAIAEKFAAQGFSIAVCARNSQELSLFAEQLQAQYKVQVLSMAFDVADKSKLEFFAEEIGYRFDRVDVLVNNAGIFKPGQISNEEEGVFEQLMAVNLAAPYYFTRKLLPVIQKNKHGHIFNICSTASITAYTNGGSYCISKFGLYGMTKVLREELKDKHIKVTAVLPGATLTSSWDGVDLPPERFVPPTDVADAIWAAYNTSPSTVMEELLIRPQLGDIG